eukprot:397465-Rhodomonas_salina.1
MDSEDDRTRTKHCEGDDTKQQGRGGRWWEGAADRLPLVRVLLAGRCLAGSWLRYPPVSPVLQSRSDTLHPQLGGGNKIDARAAHRRDCADAVQIEHTEGSRPEPSNSQAEDHSTSLTVL